LVGDRFGPQFKATLAKILNELIPHAKLSDPGVKPKVYSHKAYVKMTGETKAKVAGLYNELHEALFLDRKISFKKPIQNPESITIPDGSPCTCSVLVQCVQKCPHFSAEHTELLKKAVLSEEIRQQAKVVAHKGVQTDRVLAATPKNAPRSSQSIETTGPLREVSFSRGGVRGRGRGNFSDRGNRGKKRNRSRSFQAGQRDSSQGPSSSTSFPERGRQPFKQPNQPAQSRLQEKRAKMETPEARAQAEAVAAAAKAEADKISAQLNMDRRKPGESALDADGNIAMETCPVIRAPPGMKAYATVEKGLWKVILEPKD
jgi:hypothetical protein